MNKFKPNTIKELKHYVYALTYKEENEDVIFYIGKGQGNRVFEHFDTASKIKEGTLDLKNVNKDKINTINTKKIDAFIINAYLTNEQALMIEATLINTMRRFPHQRLTNLVKGHHSFDPENVNIIDTRISKPILLEEFCRTNNLKILVLKTNEEEYYSTINKDFRGALEGIWKLSKEKVEQVDYIVGIYRGNIYGVYKYIKDSFQLIDETWTKNKWDRWNQIHIYMGRPVNLFLEYDSSLDEVQQTGKGVLELSPVSIIESQNITFNYLPSDEEKRIGKSLLNKNIIDDKVIKTRMNGRFYFGFE